MTNKEIILLCRAMQIFEENNPITILYALSSEDFYSNTQKDSFINQIRIIMQELLAEDLQKEQAQKQIEIQQANKLSEQKQLEQLEWVAVDTDSDFDKYLLNHI